MSWINGARSLYAERGVIGLATRSIQFGYDTYVRPALPRRETRYNGVRVRAARILDDRLPFSVGHPSPTTYECGIVDALTEWVRTDDDGVIVGGA